MNPVFINLGPLEIRWYSVLILTAFLIGYFLVVNRCKKKNIPIDIITDLCFYLVIVCILGARLYYCLFEFNSYKDNLLDILKIWEGGLAIHGGIIAGIIFIYFYTKKKKLKLLEILDIIAPALVLGQAIGRWGNFFNQEAFGPIVDVSFLKMLHLPRFIIDGMYIKVNGTYSYHHPTFLYESFGCLLIFIIIMIIRNSKKIKDGQISGIYLILYGIIRFFIESLRQDSLMILNLKVAKLVSLIMIFIGLFLIIRPYIFNKTKNK